MKKILIPVFVFLLVFHLPFINKALHIDDGNFMQLTRNFNFDLSVKINSVYYFMGGRSVNSSPFDSTHPPFIPYYLKLLAAITGEDREYLLHTGFLLFPFLMVLSTALLAREFEVEVVPAILMICGNMAILPLSHNLMADAPMFSLWMLAVYLFISGIKNDSRTKVGFSFIILSIAGLMAYQTFFMLPVFLVYLLMQRRIKMKTLLLFLLPVVALGLIILFISAGSSFPFSGVISEIKRGLQEDRIFNKALSIPILLGVSSIFFLLLRYRQIISSKKDIYIFTGSAVIVIPPVISLSYPLLSSLWIIFLGAAGIFSIILTARIALREIEDRSLGIFLLFWFSIILFYNIFIMPFGALRYIMPLVAPMAFIFLNNIPKGRIAVLSGALTAMLGLAVAYGDYIYASSYRDFSAEVRRTVGQANDRVWYIGEWGMHYYMEKNGFRYLTSDSNEPRKDDLIILSDVPKLWGPSPELYPRMELIDIREIKTWYPIKVMGLQTRTGYYSTLWGYQPFTLADYPLERFGIYRVIS